MCVHCIWYINAPKRWPDCEQAEMPATSDSIHGLNACSKLINVPSWTRNSNGAHRMGISYPQSYCHQASF